MATFCLPAPMAYHVAAPHSMTTFNMNSTDFTHASRSPTSPSIPLADVVTANENWRGKNDPAERRRIQNRLNQRAFRQRQRAGESPKQYKRRVSSDCSNSQANDSDDEVDSQHSECSPEASQSPTMSYTDSHSGATSGPSTTRPGGVINPQTGQTWDELAQLINRNFLAAAVTNANHIGINLSALQSGAAIPTPRTPSPSQIPPSLKPVECQYQFPHDPIIDTIPHAMLRYNILRAIAARQVDAAAFSRSLRASGALQQLDGGAWQRVGVVVWTSSPPEQVASWELSELFVRRWGFLLKGCEDLLAATNAWRAKRGERLFPASVA